MSEKTCTQLSFELNSHETRHAQLVRKLCNKYKVSAISTLRWSYTKEECMEKFLLGAVFMNDVDVEGNICDIMIYKDRLSIISVRDSFTRQTRVRTSAAK